MSSLAKRAEDAVARGVDDDAFIARGFDHTRGGGIDDGGYAARLGVKNFAGGHTHFLVTMGVPSVARAA